MHHPLSTSISEPFAKSRTELPDHSALTRKKTRQKSVLRKLNGLLHQKPILRKFCGLLRIAIFLVIGLFIFQKTSLLVQVYGTIEDSPDRRSSLFFSLPRDTVDCLFLGNSHVYCSYIPKQIFEESGITSASLATSSQSLQNSYYLLREALKRQNPQIVILDMSAIQSAADKDVRNFRLHFTSGISLLPDLSLNKLQEYLEMKRMNYGYSDKLVPSDVYSFLEYKGDFDRENADPSTILDFLFNPAGQYKTFGFFATTTVEPLTELIPCKAETSSPITLQDTVEFSYFNKIRSLCEAHDISLLVVNAPYTSPDFDDGGLYDQFSSWLQEEGIAYLDFFPLIEDIGIDLSTDFRDEDHLNCLGASRITAYLTNYLMKHYTLSDHRGDKKYRLWEEADFDYEARYQETRENADNALS